jgi:hypothetical protein
VAERSYVREVCDTLNSGCSDHISASESHSSASTTLPRLPAGADAEQFVGDAEKEVSCGRLASAPVAHHYKHG